MMELDKKKMQAYEEIVKWRDNLEKEVREIVGTHVQYYDENLKQSDELPEFLAVAQASATALASIILDTTSTMAALMGDNSLGKEFFGSMSGDFEKMSEDMIEKRDEILEEIGLKVNEEEEETLH